MLITDLYKYLEQIDQHKVEDSYTFNKDSFKQILDAFLCELNKNNKNTKFSSESKIKNEFPKPDKLLMDNLNKEICIYINDKKYIHKLLSYDSYNLVFDYGDEFKIIPKHSIDYITTEKN